MINWMNLEVSDSKCPRWDLCFRLYQILRHRYEFALNQFLTIPHLSDFLHDIIFLFLRVENWFIIIIILKKGSIRYTVDHTLNIGPQWLFTLKWFYCCKASYLRASNLDSTQYAIKVFDLYLNQHLFIFLFTLFLLFFYLTLGLLFSQHFLFYLLVPIFYVVFIFDLFGHHIYIVLMQKSL